MSELIPGGFLPDPEPPEPPHPWWYELSAYFLVSLSESPSLEDIKNCERLGWLARLDAWRLAVADWGPLDNATDPM